MQIDNLLEDPISGEILDDPVSTPCGHTFSRSSIVQALRHNPICPLCRADLHGFNAQAEPRNVIISYLIEQYQNLQNDEEQQLNFTGTISKILDHKGEPTGYYVREIHLQNIRSIELPTLFIAVCDISGSMCGLAWRQLKQALFYMKSIAQFNPSLDIICVMYNYSARRIRLNQLTEQNIEQFNPVGGTIFKSAYKEIQHILQISQNTPYKEAIIAFMTDGQDSTRTAREILVQEFAECIEWHKPVSVHTIGFTGQCDVELLEQMRQCSPNGMFRYADPADDDEALCRKIAGVFDACSIVKNEAIIDGKVCTFKKQDDHFVNSEFVSEFAEKCTLQFEEKEMEIQLEEIESDAFDSWVKTQIDRLACDVIELSKKPSPTGISVLQQQINRIRLVSIDENILHLLDAIEQQLKNVNSNQLDIHKLYDLRYSSKFQVQVPKRTEQKRVAIMNRVEPVKIAATAWNEQRLKKISFADNPSRNDLQRQILVCKKPAKLQIDDSLLTVENITHLDSEGHNALHLAAYCGQYIILERMLKVLTGNVNVNVKDIINLTDTNGETPLTLAIKKNAWNFTIETLVKYEASCCIDRLKALQRYVLDLHNVWNLDFDPTASRTLPILNDLINANGGINQITLESSKPMTPAFIKFIYRQYKSSKKPTEVFWQICLQKGLPLFDLAKEVYSENKIDIDQEDLFCCYPLKPDAEDTELYLDMFSWIVSQQPSLIYLERDTRNPTERDTRNPTERDTRNPTEYINLQENTNNPTERDTRNPQETALHRAVEKGSLPHVQYLIEKDVNLEAKNELGNTPLWLACAKRYPCIVRELLDAGADINAVNYKGNPPLYAVCQMGPLNLAEMLVARGARVEILNHNGDNMLLISTRNGQHEILNLLINYVKKEFLQHTPEIDGFSLPFAAVEANQVECIEVLHQHGIDFNQRTALDSPVLRDATPLHLAAYYNRIEACRKLLEIGVEIDAVGCNGLTPLQLAVIQGNVEIFKLIAAAGADCVSAIKYAREPIKSMIVETINYDNLDDFKKYWHPYWNHIDNLDEEQNTPLIWAVLRGNPILVETCLKFHADPCRKNQYGISARMYADYLGMRRIIELVGVCPDEEKIRIPESDRYLLYIQDIGQTPRLNTFEDRMHCMFGDPIQAGDTQSLVPFRKIAKANKITPYMGRIRLNVLNNYVSGKFPNLTIGDLFVLQLYELIRTELNEMSFRHVCHTISKLPTYEGEVFMLLDKIYAVGEKIRIAAPVSGSSLWRIACNTLDLKHGVVAIFPGGRYLGGANFEVIIEPGEYEMQSVYHYDPICVGQANIREHTFKIRKDDAIKAVVLVFKMC